MTGSGWLTQGVCLAFCWLKAPNSCRGVRLRRFRNRMEVEGVWEGSIPEGQAAGEVLTEGFLRLGGDESCLVAVAVPDAGFSFVDLRLPPLPREPLTRALSLELRRQSPLNPERLAWGYRRLPGARTPQGVPVRLVFCQTEEWQRLMDELTAFRPGFDVILPPALALDPLLSDRTWPCWRNGSAYFRLPDGTGGRRLLTTAPESTVLFGAGARPLELPGLTLPPALAARPAAEQALFAPAVIAGLYALSPALGQDAKTWLPVPEELRFRRNLAARRLGLALGAYAAAGLTLWAAVAAVRNQRQIHVLNNEIAQLERNARGKNADRGRYEFVQKFLAECREAGVDRPGLPLYLAELTRQIGDGAWVQTLAWRNGGRMIELDLTMTDANADVLAAIRESPYLTDVVSLRKKVEASGGASLRLQMQARAPKSRPAVAAGLAPSRGTAP